MAANILARRYPGWNQASPWFPVALDVPKGRVVFQRGRLRVHLAALSWTLTYIVIVWALVCVGLAFDQSSVLALGLAVAWIAVPRNVLRVGSKVTVSRRLGMKIVGFGAARAAAMWPSMLRRRTRLDRGRSAASPDRRSICLRERSRS